MNLSIELGQSGKAGYGSIHKTGCRDLSDGEVIGDASSRSEIDALVRDATGWSVEETDEYTADDSRIAPCVRLA